MVGTAGATRSQNVTGPSLVRVTCMSAPKWPLPTCGYPARARAFFAARIRERAVAKQALEQPLGLRLCVAALNADQHQQPAPNRGNDRAIDGDLSAAHALKQPADGGAVPAGLAGRCDPGAGYSASVGTAGFTRVCAVASPETWARRRAEAGPRREPGI